MWLIPEVSLSLASASVRLQCTHPWNSPRQITKLLLPLVILFCNRYACILLWSQWKLTLISSTAWDTGILFMAASRRSCSTSTWVCCSTDGIWRGMRFEAWTNNVNELICIFEKWHGTGHNIFITTKPLFTCYANIVTSFQYYSTPTIRVPSQCSPLINSPSPSSSLPLWVSYL